MGLYVDQETGRDVATHSMIKTFRRCPKQAQYKYFERLKPRVLGRPLREGSWMHRLLEVHYRGGDWKAEHKRLSADFAKLFDEEKAEIGDLPRDCARMMTSYLWHYAKDPWKVHEVEFVLEAEFPDGTLYRGKIDLLIENQYGLWIVDHKFNKRLPNLDFRILDAQSALYIWAALKNKIPVQGHIWNYVRRKPPTMPQLLKNGSRLSKRAIDTDYPTMVTAIKRYGLEVSDYESDLRYLKKLQYEHGKPQLSSFFLRSVLEKTPSLLKQVAREGYHTARRFNEYDFSRTDFVERVPDRSCTFMCSYTDLCTLELFGGNTVGLRRQRYTVGDPNDYYNDEDSRFEKQGDSDG